MNERIISENESFLAHAVASLFHVQLQINIFNLVKMPTAELYTKRE